MDILNTGAKNMLKINWPLLRKKCMHRINDLGYTIQENAPHLSVDSLEKKR